MEKEKIVKAFFEKGHLLTEDALAFLSSSQVGEDALRKGYGDLVLDAKHFHSPVQEESVRILKNLVSKPEDLTTDDFVNFYTSKYDKMSRVITERLKKDFVSINKIGTLAEHNIIGIVKDKRKKNNKDIITFEDKTGRISAAFDASDATEELDIDDVVAAEVLRNNDIYFGKGIFFPDVPLRRVTTGSGAACFISDLHLDEAPLQFFEKFLKWFQSQNMQYLFVAGDTGDKKKFESLVKDYCRNKKVFIISGCDGSYPCTPVTYSESNIISLSNPAMVEINGVKILMIHRMDMGMLKKRYLGKSKTILPEDYLVLDEVPDIVHFGHTHKPSIINHKSITLVNGGSLLTEFMPVVVNFSTREAEHVKPNNF